MQGPGGTAFRPLSLNGSVEVIPRWWLLPGIHLSSRERTPRQRVHDGRRRKKEVNAKKNIYIRCSPLEQWLLHHPALLPHTATPVR